MPEGHASCLDQVERHQSFLAIAAMRPQSRTFKPNVPNLDGLAVMDRRYN